MTQAKQSDFSTKWIQITVESTDENGVAWLKGRKRANNINNASG